MEEMVKSIIKREDIFQPMQVGPLGRRPELREDIRTPESLQYDPYGRSLFLLEQFPLCE